MDKAKLACGVRVEVLVFDGCPHIDVTLERVRSAIDEANVRANIRLVRVRGEDHARRLRFLGSPSVRVDGIDVDPSAASPDDYGRRCRIYSVGSRFEGAPPIDWIVSALRDQRIHRVGEASSDGAACDCSEEKCR